MYRSTPVVAMLGVLMRVYPCVGGRIHAGSLFSDRGWYRGTAPVRGVVWVGRADCRLCCSAIHTRVSACRPEGCSGEFSLPLQGRMGGMIWDACPTQMQLRVYTSRLWRLRARERARLSWQEETL